MQRLWFVGGLIIVALVAASLAPLTPSTIAQSLIGTVNVGDNPGATVADPLRNLVYVVCEYDDTIYVLDGNSNTVVRTIPLPYNISGAALDPIANRLYVASCSPIHVLDAATGNEVGAINECVFHPEELAIDPGRHRLLVSDESGLIGVSDYVNIYDTRTLQRVARVEIGYSTVFRDVAVAVNAVSGMGYASYDAQPNLVFFDVMTGEIRHQVRDISATHGVAADPVLNRVYVRCLNEIAVFDGTTAARVGSIPVAGIIGLNCGARRVYSWKSQDMRVFDANTLTAVGTVRVPGTGYAGTMPALACWRRWGGSIAR
ncbi:MAG: YncE family protein [Chloroflexi bacterium]|nr:YncE family protein [Chloroflexota bacterium]